MKKINLKKESRGRRRPRGQTPYSITEEIITDILIVEEIGIIPHTLLLARKWASTLIATFAAKKPKTIWTIHFSSLSPGTINPDVDLRPSIGRTRLSTYQGKHTRASDETV